MAPLIIKIYSDGLIADHNMPCVVNQTKSAIYDCNTGVFQPAWIAKVWRRVQAKNKFQQWILTTFFKL